MLDFKSLTTAQKANALKPDRPCIAIVGAGLTGLCLSVSLSDKGIPHRVYESQWPESLAPFATMGPNAIRALELIDPRLKDCFLRCATFDSSSVPAVTWSSYRRGLEQKYKCSAFDPRDDLLVDFPGDATRDTHRRGCALVREFLRQVKALIPPENLEVKRR